MFHLAHLITHPNSYRKAVEEIDIVSKYVSTNLKAADLKISLYVAACGGLPLAQVHPSPPAISSEVNRITNASSLGVNDYIPPPECLLKYLKQTDRDDLQNKTHTVLKWLLTGLRDPKIICVPAEDHKSTIALVGSGRNVNNAVNELIPEEIFSLHPHFMSTLGQDWKLKSSYMKTSYGFLPTKVEELHCLIYKGLVSTAFEPDGSIVLHTDLNYCLTMTPSTWTWGKSALGVNLKIVALVEFVDNPTFVKTEVGDVGQGTFGSITLENYKLMDPAYGRIRYLLIYPQEKRKLNIKKSSLKRDKRLAHFTIFFAWAVALSLACFLPKVDFVEKPQ